MYFAPKKLLAMLDAGNLLTGLLSYRRTFRPTSVHWRITVYYIPTYAQISTVNLY